MTNIVLGNISSFVNDSTAVAQYNANNALITTAFSDALSKTGESPNTMSAVLDMNNFNIVNLPSPATINSPVRLVDVINPSVALTVPPVGTSGSKVPLLNGINTWSAVQNYTASVGMNEANPGTGVASIATGVFWDIRDTSNANTSAIVTVPQQASIYAIGPFAGYAFFQQFGDHSPAYAWSLTDNSDLALLYDTDSFMRGSTPASTNTPMTITPTWQYYQPLTCGGTTPAFNNGLAIGWNQSNSGGEVNIVGCTENNTITFKFQDWSQGLSVLTDLMTLTSPAFSGGANVLIGSSYPNGGSVGRLNVNSAGVNTVGVFGSSVSNTSLSTYFSGPLILCQLNDNTVNDTFSIDFRGGNASKGSYAAIVAQVTAISTGLTGALNFNVANNTGAATVNALTVTPTSVNCNIPLVVPTYTYATLPSLTTGMIVRVSDSTTNTWGANITVGGGGDNVIAWYNGSNLTVMGK